MSSIIENKWDINHIQTLLAQIQQKVLWKTLVFITHLKNWCIWITDQKKLENCFENMNLFSWINLISVLIHFKYWYYNIPSLELPSLPCHLCQISPWLIETPLQQNPDHVLDCFPILSYPIRPHATIIGCTKTCAIQSQQIYYQAIYISIPCRKNYMGS